MTAGDDTWTEVGTTEGWADADGRLAATSPLGPVLVWGTAAEPKGAIIAVCPHKLAPLAAEDVCAGEVACRRHGVRYDLATGEHVDLGRLSYPPRGLMTLEMRTRDGRIEVRRPTDPASAPTSAPATTSGVSCDR
ncbi:Rieske 2Fe-2S domain-containing protein [Streptomyces sp. NBC_00726]|uniref:Rieske (2Fe-2S) protein n=1 Tax=Streptomyces sp. NBC_00726 TaxID=2903674 RepID=UPI0038645433